MQSLLYLLLLSPSCAFPSAFVSESGEEDIYISINVGEGAYLLLTNNQAYEVKPIDRVFSEAWIVPFPVKIAKGNSNDPYPILIKNLYSNTTVHAKTMPYEDFLSVKEGATGVPPPLNPVVPQTPTSKSPAPSAPNSTPSPAPSSPTPLPPAPLPPPQLNPPANQTPKTTK